jgi:serine/threonine-protein kinase RsbT
MEPCVAPASPSSVEVLEDEATIKIASSGDILPARRKGRELARQIGFSAAEATLIVTVISELTRNIVVYARRGEIILRRAESAGRPGIVMVVRDGGPGIPDLRQALCVGFSTSGSLGLGLPGVKRLMDEFEIVSEVGTGTTVTVKKWINGSDRLRVRRDVSADARIFVT